MRFFALLLLLQATWATAQQNESPLRIDPVRDAEGNYNFYVDNEAYCDYTVLINFTQLTNLYLRYPMPFSKTIGPGRTLLFNLHRANPNAATMFDYQMYSVAGTLNPRIDTTLNYLLPVAPDKITEVGQIEYFQLNDKMPAPKDFYALSFSLEEGDTIFATRRGTVCEVNDTTHLEHNGYLMASADNMLSIAHPDGTFGYYQVFSEALVEPGDEVLPGEPIAIAGGKEYAHKEHVRFWVQFTTTINGKNYSEGWYNTFLKMKFTTGETENQYLEPETLYRGAAPEKVVIAELSKRELRKRVK